MKTRIWVQIRTADGVESEPQDSKSFPSIRRATAHAQSWTERTGNEAFVFADATVIAHFVSGIMGSLSERRRLKCRKKMEQMLEVAGSGR